MTGVVALVAVVWTAVALVVGVLIGRGMKLADRWETEARLRGEAAMLRAQLDHALDTVSAAARAELDRRRR